MMSAESVETAADISAPTEHDRMVRVLVVEDDRAQLLTLTSLLEREGFMVTGCLTAREALEHLDRREFDVAVLDLRLPDLPGTKLLEKMQSRDEGLRVVVYTGYGSFDSAKEAVNLGAFAYVEKAGDPGELVRHVHRAVRDRMERYAVELEAAVAQRTASLRESEERFHLAVRGTSDGLWDWNITSGKQWWSPRFRELIGYDIDELPSTNESWKSLLHPDDLERTLEAVGRHLEEGHDYDLEYRLKTKNHGYRWFLARGVAVKDETGRPVRMAGSIQDIHERKRAEEALRFTQFSVDHAADAAFWIGPDARFIYVNEPACRSLGYSREELLSMAVPDIDPDFPAEVWPARWEELRSRGSFVVESHHRRKDGHVFPVEVAVNYLEFDGKEFNCAFVRDITERKRAEEELARYRDHLEELVETRTADLEASQERLRNAERLASLGTLAAGLAHEINNPVGSLLLAAENGLKALEDASALPFARRCFRDVLREGKRCGDVVRSVLQFARQEPAEKWLIDLDQVVGRAVAGTREYAAKHGVLLQCEPADPLPQINGNPVELELVLVNLIRNAVEACRPGGRVTIRRARSSRAVRLLVRDNGRGLAAEQLKQAFDPFYTTRQTDGGTGLGLSIAHGIIKGHGGDIQLESRPGEGATVLVELPISYLSEGV